MQYFSRNDFRACLLVNTVDRSNQLANMQIINLSRIPICMIFAGLKVVLFKRETFLSEFLFKLFDREKVLHNCNRQKIHVAETTCTPASAIFFFFFFLTIQVLASHCQAKQCHLELSSSIICTDISLSLE